MNDHDTPLHDEATQAEASGYLGPFETMRELATLQEATAQSSVQRAYISITQAEYERLKTFCYHTVPPVVQLQINATRMAFMTLALQIIHGQSPTRAQSLALTHLEDAQMRAIQGLALQGTPQLPPEFQVTHP